MPSKIQLDENLWFLFICLQKSDYKSIDFHAVGRATNLKAPAARMRYTRLRRQIEGGLLMDSDGVPFGRSANERLHLKRKTAERVSQQVAEINAEAKTETEVELDNPEKKVKLEFDSDDSDLYETEESSGSEDDKPRTKRRGALGGGAERFVLGTVTRAKVKCEEEGEDMTLLPELGGNMDVPDVGSVSDIENPAMPVIDSPIIKAEPFPADEVMSAKDDLLDVSVGDDEHMVGFKRQLSSHPSPLATLPTPLFSCVKRKSRSRSPPFVKSEGKDRGSRVGSQVNRFFRNPWVQSSVAGGSHVGKGSETKSRISRSV